MKRLLIRFAGGAALAAAVLAAWAFWWEPRRLVVREHTMQLSCWTGPPLRIGVISDVHAGAPYIGRNKLARIVTLTNAQKPDMIVLLGDFVIQGVKGGRFVPPEEIGAMLRDLSAPLGVFAVLGNHDHWLDGPRVERALRRGHMHVLEDRAVQLRRRDGTFWLVGVSDYMTAPHDVRGAMAQVRDGTAPVIVITHNPDVFPLIPRRACLTIAGHTHGGQVALPLLGRPIVPSHYGDDYAIGHIRQMSRDLFVTSGVGTSIIPVRFRVPPEVVILTLQGSG